MNIHEHQAKIILKNFNINVPNGVAIFSLEEIDKKSKILKTSKVALKAQIHAGGRGKAGGVKLLNKSDCETQIKKMFGKVLVTHQTGPEGKKVKRVFYLSCLIDRSSSKIAFISSGDGGIDIENVAKSNPEKITTVKMNLSESVNSKDIKKIINPFKLSEKVTESAFDLIQSIYKVLIEKDANLIEINPLILTKDNNLL